MLRERHIYYYEKKASRTPVGYLDLRRAKVSSGAAAGSFKCRESNDAGFWSALGMDAPRFTVKEAAGRFRRLATRAEARTFAP